MEATKFHKPAPHDQMFGGMNRSVKSTVIPANQWRTSFNVRPYNSKQAQVPRKVLLYNVCDYPYFPITNLLNLPCGMLAVGNLLALTQSRAFRLTSTAAERLVNAQGVEIAFEYQEASYLRWSTCTYRGAAYFVNPLNGIHSYDGKVVKKLANAPAGYYVTTFFDHIIVAALQHEGEGNLGKLAWSGLHAFEDWTSSTYGESDVMEFNEEQMPLDSLTGITGMARLGNRCIIYTASALYDLKYTGIQAGVCRMDPIWTTHGCGFRYGLVTFGDLHFFPDLRTKSFFRFDGQAATDIGSPIMDYVFEDMNPDAELLQRMYGYVDPMYREIHWVYVSVASSGDFDHEVVYNYANNTWYAGSVENVHSFFPGGKICRRANELEGFAYDLYDANLKLDDTGTSLGRIFGTGCNQLLREELPTDDIAELLEQELPYLESGDFTYGELASTKELSTMALQAQYVVGSGVEVYLFARDQIDAAVVWDLVGTWTPAMRENLLTSLRASGKVFRFKFMGKADGDSYTKTLRLAGDCPDELYEGYNYAEPYLNFGTGVCTLLPSLTGAGTGGTPEIELQVQDIPASTIVSIIWTITINGTSIVFLSSVTGAGINKLAFSVPLSVTLNLDVSVVVNTINDCGTKEELNFIEWLETAPDYWT